MVERVGLKVSLEILSPVLVGHGGGRSRDRRSSHFEEETLYVGKQTSTPIDSSRPFWKATINYVMTVTV